MMSAIEQFSGSKPSPSEKSAPVGMVSVGGGELAPSRSLSLSLPLLLLEVLVNEMADPGEDDNEVDEANLAVGDGGEPAAFLIWDKENGLSIS